MCILMLPVWMVANSHWLHFLANLPLSTASWLLEAMTEAWPVLGGLGHGGRPQHTGLSIDRGKALWLASFFLLSFFAFFFHFFFFFPLSFCFHACCCMEEGKAGGRW